jgi:ribosomal protein L21
MKYAVVRIQGAQYKVSEGDEWKSATSADEEKNKF